ncbi:P-loop containing nucleoside triphosphate hydrolase protein, partial [Dunaliella salina]
SSKKAASQQQLEEIKPQAEGGNHVVALTAASTHPLEAGPLPDPAGSSVCFSTRWMVCCALPVLLPFCALWYALAFLIAWLITGLIFPSAMLASRMYWACPFVPFIWKRMGPVKGSLIRIGFESSYAINVYTRLLTLPLRPYLPGFYLIGFPKCGTTSLAGHMRNHPGICGPDGLPYHEALSKETHYFAGVMGRSSASSARLYKSFFPTIMSRWWAIAVHGVKQWQVFDACPVHACLPYVARRIAAITPKAKIVVMVRDPVEGLFSAEIMLRDLGVPLDWASLSEPGQGVCDMRFQVLMQFPLSDEELWKTLSNLGPDDPLPADMPASLYFSLSSLIRCGDYAKLLEPYFQHFPPENIMVVNFSDYKWDPEAVVEEVLRFVNADMSKHKFTPLPPAMQNSYAGRKVHPAVAARLRSLYKPSVLRLQASAKSSKSGMVWRKHAQSMPFSVALLYVQ